MAYGVNAPTGFVAKSTILGAPATAAIGVPLFLDPAGTTAIGSGDLLTFAASGYVTVATAGDSNSFIGAFAGCEYTASSSVNTAFPAIWAKYWSAPGTAALQSQTVTASVFMDPNIIYSVQANTAVSSGYAFADVGGTASMVAGTPNATTGNSSQTLGAVGTSANSQFRIIGLDTSISGNAWGVVYNNVLVVSNWSVFTQRSAGI